MPPIRRRRRAPGQSLVEFALVFPIFVVMLLGLLEFGFVFNAVLAVNFASRDAALAAAEAGDVAGGDCFILKAVDGAIDAPAADSRIQSVTIYRASPTGAQIGDATVYVRDEAAGNTSICAAAGGSTMSYRRTANGYPESSRCNILGGCDPNSTNDTVDNVAVRVTYAHPYLTPIKSFFGGSGATLVFDRESVMRMEPVL